MTLQSSGAISLADIQTEFGGSNPIGINEYYGVAAGVPASGTISLNNFYGKSAGGGGNPAFSGWMGPYPGPRTLGWSEVVDPVNTTNSFTGNTVTPGRQTRFTIYTQTYTTNSVTLRFYLAGSLNTTWTGGSHTFTPVIGSSSIRFDSTITDTDPYYGGGQGHYTPSATIYAIYADLSGIGVEVYYHEFEYANIGDPDYDD